MKSCAWAARAAVIASTGAGLGPAVDQVVADRAAEQKRLLEHHADVPAEVARGQLAHVDAVEQHPARVDVVEAADQVHERRLAAAAATDDADLFARPDREVHLREDRTMALVAEGHVVEADLALGLRHRLGLGRLVGLGRRIEQLEDARAAGHEARQPGRQLRYC